MLPLRLALRPAPGQFLLLPDAVRAALGRGVGAAEVGDVVAVGVDLVAVLAGVAAALLEETAHGQVAPARAAVPVVQAERRKDLVVRDRDLADAEGGVDDVDAVGVLLDVAARGRREHVARRGGRRR